MGQGNCINCGEGDAESCDLQVRNRNHTGVLLCATCRASIERELDGPAGR